MSAFRVLYGYDPKPPVFKKVDSIDVATGERHHQVLENIIESKVAQQSSYNNQFANQKKFSVGEDVWVVKRKPEHTFDSLC